MKKVMKYETPEIEITRFDVAIAIMNDISIGNGATNEDGDNIPEPGESFADSDNLFD